MSLPNALVISGLTGDFAYLNQVWDIYNLIPTVYYPINKVSAEAIAWDTVNEKWILIDSTALAIWDGPTIEGTPIGDYSARLGTDALGTAQVLSYDVDVVSHFTTTEKFKSKLSKLAAENNLTFQIPDKEILLRRLNNAYEEIAAKLMARGMTELDISTWRRGEEFQLDIATYWYAKDSGWGGKTIEDKDWTKVFNRTLELETTSIISNTGTVLKSGKGPVAVGMKLMDINMSLGLY